MKALHILYSGLGGTASVAFSLLNENRKNFLIEQNFLFTGGYISKDYIRKVNEFKSRYSYINTKKYLSWISWFEIFSKLCKEKPNLIILHNYQFVPCLFYKILFKTKIIFVDHQANDTRVIVNLLACFISLLFFENIICVSKIKYKYFKETFNFFSNKINFIPNSVNINFFKKGKKIKPNTHFRIGMASRIDNSKRQDLIIKALNHDNLKSLNIVLTIAGDGNNLIKLKKLVKSENLKSKVKFEGVIDEKKLKLWYEKLNLYIQATEGEGMSISIFEAMSMSVPVIGSRVNGVKNLLGKKKFIGVLFDNTITDLSKKIKYFYKLSNQNKKLFGKYQRKFVIKYHSNPVMFNNYKKIILRTLPELID